MHSHRARPTKRSRCADAAARRWLCGAMWSLGRGKHLISVDFTPGFQRVGRCGCCGGRLRAWPVGFCVRWITAAGCQAMDHGNRPKPKKRSELSRKPSQRARPVTVQSAQNAVSARDCSHAVALARISCEKPPIIRRSRSYIFPVGDRACDLCE